MKILYPGKVLTIYVNDNQAFRIIPKKDFDALLVKGVTRKKAREFKIGSRLWNNSYNYHYKAKEIEKHRVDKIKSHNALNRYMLWENKLEALENISPGITNLFKTNVKNNPEIIMAELERLNDMFHEMKIFVRTSKKYIRQACIRKGVQYTKMVANTSEYTLKKLLKELGYKPLVQPYINKLWYDFQVGATLIELDGESYHTDERDKYKEKIAKENGYSLLRISCKELEDIESLKSKLSLCLKEAK